MPTRRLVDADRKGRCDADQKAGRCRPEGSMRCRPEGSMPTRRVVDADQQGRCYGEFRHVRKSRNVKQSEFWKSPERKVGGLTRPESTGTPNSRNTDSFRNTEVSSRKRRNTEEPELPTQAETPEVRLERKISGNLDIRKKESRRPMRNRRPDRMSGERTQDGKPEPEEAAEDVGKAWSLEGPKPKSRRARRASS
jgi:hypothetical protein